MKETNNQNSNEKTMKISAVSDKKSDATASERSNMTKKISVGGKTAAGASVAKKRKPASKKTAHVMTPEERKAERSRKIANHVSVASTMTVVLVYIAVVVGISAIISICGIRWANDIFALVKEDVTAVVTIPESATLSEVSTLLKTNGIIEYPSIFRAYIGFKNRDSETALSFKAGPIELSSKLNYDQIVSTIRDRKARGIVKITIPEGYTVDDIINLFVSQGIGTREGFVEAVNNYDYKNHYFIEQLKKIELSPERKYRLEGYLFPDTYEFYADSSEVAIVDKMLTNFDYRFEKDYYARLDELGMNLDQVITLASIVQMEGKFGEDLYPIAGVFHNRLKSRNLKRLQSDATIQYCLPERKAELTSADLAIESPYNSYLNTGLPPSAISNPGWEAIQATLYPEEHTHYYFISDIDGSTIFADTEAQHANNVVKLRQAKKTGVPID